MASVVVSTPGNQLLSFGPFLPGDRVDSLIVSGGAVAVTTLQVRPFELSSARVTTVADALNGSPLFLGSDGHILTIGAAGVVGFESLQIGLNWLVEKGRLFLGVVLTVPGSAQAVTANVSLLLGYRWDPELKP
jgi:hypothetical protein